MNPTRLSLRLNMEVVAIMECEQVVFVKNEIGEHFALLLDHSIDEDGEVFYQAVNGERRTWLSPEWCTQLDGSFVDDLRRELEMMGIAPNERKLKSIF